MVDNSRKIRGKVREFHQKVRQFANRLIDHSEEPQFVKFTNWRISREILKKFANSRMGSLRTHDDGAVVPDRGEDLTTPGNTMK